jgi:hypothetical protein
MWILPSNHPLYSAFAPECVASKKELQEHLRHFRGYGGGEEWEERDVIQPAVYVEIESVVAYNLVAQLMGTTLQKTFFAWREMPLLNNKPNPNPTLFELKPPSDDLPF